MVVEDWDRNGTVRAIGARQEVALGSEHGRAGRIEDVARGEIGTSGEFLTGVSPIVRRARDRHGLERIVALGGPRPVFPLHRDALIGSEHIHRGKVVHLTIGHIIQFGVEKPPAMPHGRNGRVGDPVR